MSAFGKLFILSGLALIILGGLFLSGRWDGIRRLPGDILVQRDRFTFYFPITTCILISMIVSFLIWLFSRR